MMYGEKEQGVACPGLCHLWSYLDHDIAKRRGRSSMQGSLSDISVGSSAPPSFNTKPLYSYHVGAFAQSSRFGTGHAGHGGCFHNAHKSKVQCVAATYLARNLPSIFLLGSALQHIRHCVPCFSHVLLMVFRLGVNSRHFVNT